MDHATPIEEQHFETLLKTLPEGINADRVRRAFDFARKAHEHQFRMSGEPYICHPLAAAQILAELGVDEDTIIAGLLHDVPEDTRFTIQDVERRFGKRVAKLVDALTKLSKVYYRHSMDERQVESLRKMFLETANDVRVVVVKLADRLHNMQTLHYLRPEKQQRIARETMKIYAPLANLFGIYQLRRQLEDLSFKVLQPEEYARIEAYVHDHEKKRLLFIQDTLKILTRCFKKAGIEVEMEGRSKHFYSIYQKMVRDRKEMSDIYDYFAVRIQVKHREDCYRALDIVHQCFKPKPGRFKDYIAVPKVNGYQSLHTTVVGLRGRPTEIQIRTEDMHYEAEYGAAAHILYKQELQDFVSTNIDLLKKYRNPGNFIRSLEEDILQNRIYVFSASGDVINLPEGATVLDYLYSMNFPVDHRICRVVVNGQSYSLVGQLQSGDHIDVLVTEEKVEGPERWWMGHVKTALAKKKLREHFGKQSFDERVESGRALLQQELDHEQQGLLHQIPSALLRKVPASLNEPDFASVLAKIGEGTYRANDVYQLMFPDLDLPLSTRAWRRLLGFFSELELAQRLNIGEKDDKYRIRVRVIAYDRVGLLQEIAAPCYELDIPIIRFHGKGHDTKKSPLRQLPSGHRIPMSESQISKVTLEVYVDNHEVLIALFDRLEKIPGLLSVQRVFRRKQLTFFAMLTLTSAYLIAHPFILMFLKAQEFASEWLFFAFIYGAIALVFLLLLLLRSMGNKTFPHFEETRAFWPLAFGVTVILIITQFINDHAFDLHLHTPFLVGLSLVGVVFLFLSYQSHERRKRRLLKKMDSNS